MGWDKDSLIWQQRKNTNSTNNTNSNHNKNVNNEYAKQTIYNTFFLTAWEPVHSQTPSSDHGTPKLWNSPKNSNFQKSSNS